ncbi:packaged DNA stabilization protein [Aquirhabdus parva]|uniref:Ubiquitin-activating enzyme E1 FCCH domain-containing protein n=1 Tax=Aquirhabdus parva TaxID=2283318 RepID=A0A345P9A0_9GAMM|nr:packaged DNA stabilization protein [Aquirhabdus parva]AXI03859.1 hypothetical protein HYN46_14045 [Aquirhabdus parva]
MANLPIVGPAYQLSSLVIDCQNTINWYPQAIEVPNGTRVSALIPTPGLVRAFLGDEAPVRALRVLSNGALLAVIGKKLYHSPAGRFNLTQITGTIMGLGLVSIADNGTVAMIVNGSTNQVLDLKTLVLTTLQGSNIPRSSFVLFLDGRFVLNKEKSDRFVWTDLYSTNIDGASYATAEASPDPMVAMVEFQREIWMFGTQTTERYYSNQDLDLPFARMPGGVLEIGCAAANSVVRFGAGVVWLAVTEFGSGQIMMGSGGLPERISNHAIEAEISSYPTLKDAVAYAYQQNGHSFYVISFPSGNTTFVFDATTQLWHQRSWTNRQGQHDRHRAHVHAFFNETHYVGDYSNGKIYALDPKTYSDDGNVITRERTCPVVETGGAMSRYSRLEIVCETGNPKQKKNPDQPILKRYTSQMYPVMVVEALTSAGAIDMGHMLYSPNTIELLDVSAGISSIDIQTLVSYRNYSNYNPELLDVSASITGLTLDVLASYGIYTNAPEFLDTSASITAMSISKQLVQTSMQSEYLDVSSLITGIALI